MKSDFSDKNWGFATVCSRTERLCHSTPLQHQHNFAPVEQEEHQTSAPMKLLKKKRVLFAVPPIVNDMTPQNYAI